MDDKLKKDPTTQYKKYLVSILQKLEKDKDITANEKRKLYPTSEGPPHMRSLVL